MNLPLSRGIEIEKGSQAQRSCELTKGSRSRCLKRTKPRPPKDGSSMYSGAARVLHHVGAWARNPSIAEEYKRLKDSEWLSLPELLAVQLTRARDFLIFAGAHSPYYGAVFRERNFDPQRLDSIEQLRELPAITKAELVTRNRDVHATHEFGRCFVAETSGTSGAALGFRKDERWDSAVRAHVMRAYDWYGVNAWDQTGYLWGYDITPRQALKTRLLDALQNRFRLFSYDEKRFREFALRLTAARCLAGYSSMIYEIGKRILDMGLETPKLRLVKGTSEMILDAYQDISQQAFGMKIVSEYGAAEAGLIAFECPAGSMHINVEDVVLEVDEEGEVIVTNLLSRSFPIVRYRLGDTVSLSADRCPCGRSHPVLKDIVGRRGASLMGTHRKYPAFTFYYVFKNLAIRESLFLNYKVVQGKQGSAVIFLEGKPESAAKLLLEAELTKYFGDDVDFELRFVKSFDIERRKAQYFESHVQQP
jgi:phenylacetate-coenzyme A ligase PaaK-like adenylate-forming protein